MSNKPNKIFVPSVQVLYLIFLCALWAIPVWPRGLWWLSDLIVILPVWVLFIPPALSFLMSIRSKDMKGIVINIICCAVIFFGIMGYNIILPDMAQPSATAPFSLKVITANMGNVTNLDDFFRMVAQEDPDVIVFQEFSPELQEPLDSGFMGSGWDIKIEHGLALASRLKIRSMDLNERPPFGAGRGRMATYELETPVGLVYILDVHLGTLREGVEAVMERSFDAIKEMQRVTDQQENQSLIAASVACDLKPLIVAGDFNMPESSPIFRAYWSKYGDAFDEKGAGFGFTKHTRWYGVRIDRIVHDRNWRALEARVGPDIGSDHSPVIARLVFTGKAVPLADPQKTAPNAGGKVAAMVPLAQMETSGTFPDWDLERFSMISFGYIIPQGATVAMGVKTAWGDWICLGGTGTDQCPAATMVPDKTVFINDGMRHAVKINVRSGVQGVLPMVKLLTGYQFFGSGKLSASNPLVIDHLKIFARDGKLDNSMEAK